MFIIAAFNKLNSSFYKVQNRKQTNRIKLVVQLALFFLIGPIFSEEITAQQVSPIQTGHYSPAFMNIRDMAKGAPGLAIVWYNQYLYSNEYVDKDGNKYSKIPLDELLPGLPEIDLSVDMSSFATIPAFFYGLPFTVLGGAQWMIGVVPNYIWSDASFITEQRGGTIDSVYSGSGSSRLSGFGDLYIAPIGLTWGWDHLDLTFYYGFTAPTGRYQTGADDNIGLGFWTHQPQIFTYFYPNVDQSTAIMLGFTYELNGNIKGEDFNPGNRFTFEYGISQYLSERFELGVIGGNNWQVTEDRGEDVYWDPSIRDRKGTLAFTAGYWAWKGRLQVNFKYGFDYGMLQRFKTNYFMLNIVFATNALTGNKSNKNSGPNYKLND